VLLVVGMLVRPNIYLVRKVDVAWNGELYTRTGRSPTPPTGLTLVAVYVLGKMSFSNYM
jgi:hypothetical protein